MRLLLIAMIVMLPFSLMSQNKADTSVVIKIGPCTESRDNNESPLVFLVYGNNEILVEFNDIIGVRFSDLADEIENIVGVKVDLVSKDGIKEKYFKAIDPDLIYV